MSPKDSKPARTKLEIEQQIEELETLLETFPKGCSYEDANSWRVLGDTWANWVIVLLAGVILLEAINLCSIESLTDRVKIISDNVDMIPRQVSDPYSEIISCAEPLSGAINGQSLTYTCHMNSSVVLGARP